MIVETDRIDSTIHTVAVRRLGVADSAVVRVAERATDWSEEGIWFGLSVKLPGDREWKTLGRRRTKVELLALASTIDPLHLSGRRFD